MPSGFSIKADVSPILVQSLYGAANFSTTKAPSPAAIAALYPGLLAMRAWTTTPAPITVPLNAKTAACLLLLVGGGGGGAASTGTPAARVNVGRGGGAGGVLEAYVTLLTAAQRATGMVVTSVGVGGAGGTVSTAPGAGTLTRCTLNGQVYQAGGGAAAAAGSATTSPIPPVTVTPGSSGTATFYLLRGAGGTGDSGTKPPGAIMGTDWIVEPGKGGSTIYGQSGRIQQMITQPGPAGRGYGAGGTAGMVVDGSGTANGAAGTGGILVLWEFAGASS